MPTPVVDTHVHYWEAESAERPYDPDGMRIGDPIDVEQMLGEMDRAGVDKIIQVTPSIMGFDNRYALEGAARHPDRIRVFGRFDPTKPDVAGRLAGWLDQPSMIGIRFTLFPAQIPWLTDGTLDSFWAAAERLDIPVAVYAGDRAKLLGDVGRRHPGMRLLVDHLTLHYAPNRADRVFDRWAEVLTSSRSPTST